MHRRSGGGGGLYDNPTSALCGADGGGRERQRLGGDPLAWELRVEVVGLEVQVVDGRVGAEGVVADSEPRIVGLLGKVQRELHCGRIDELGKAVHDPWDKQNVTVLREVTYVVLKLNYQQALKRFIWTNRAAM